MRFALPFAASLALLCSQPVLAQQATSDPATILSEAGPGTRWGMVVTDRDGREIVAIDPDGRYIPASNTKVFTTATAMWRMVQGDFPDPLNGGARVRVENSSDAGPPNLCAGRLG